MKNRPKSLVLFAMLVLALPCFAAEKTTVVSVRAKLGLVLEGGGALGLAHIGVIQYLEEHRIPVSYIAGTSMGGLVGGVYSTGRNAAEVRDVVKTINWDEVISGQVPFKDLSYRRKEDAHEYPSTLEFGLHHGLQFPSGFNSGQHVAMILDQIAVPYSQIKSFNDLPIPFACVATDLVSGSQHVFRSGPLDVALRSTMSLPGVFSPVRFGDHIYVDGGLLNNFPTGVAKEMGADVVLGVHLQIAPLNPEEHLSSFGVLGQALTVVVAANERESMAEADILINVPLQSYTSMDYNKADSLIKAGYDAAATNAEKLATLSVDEETWKEYLFERDTRRSHPSVPQFVVVAGVQPDAAKSIEGDLSGLVGQPIETTKIDDEIMELSGMGEYSNISYEMVEQNGKQGLLVDVERKSFSPPLVRPLLVIDGANYNNVFFSIGARVTFLDFGGYRRELRNDVILGSQYGLDSEYYRPFTSTSNWFVAPRIALNSYQYPVFNGNDLISIYRNRLALGGVDVGYGFGRTSELRFGYEGGYQHLSPQFGNTQVLQTVSGATGDIKIQFSLTTLDNPVVPRSGESLKIFTKYYNANPGAPEGFPLSQVENQNVFRINDPSSVFLNAFGGTSYGYKTGVPAFALGGTTRFIAYGTNELLTNQYFLFQTGYIRQLKKLPPLLGSTVDFMGMFEVGKTYQLPNGPKPPYLPGDVAAALIVNTLFGPVEIGGAVGNYGHAKFFFQIGRIF